MELEVAHVAAADDEPGDGCGRDARAAQHRGVRRDLEQGRDALAPGELGVADEPAVGGALEEVGVPDEGAVEERRLVDDLGRRAQRLDRLRVRLLEGLAGVAGSLELHDPAPVRRHEPAQLGLLVLVAERDDARGHRVVGGGDRGGPPEGDVEGTHQRELARRGRAQVTRADDEPLVVAEEEHAPNLAAPPDTAPRPPATPPRPLRRPLHRLHASYGTPSAAPFIACYGAVGAVITTPTAP